jgi:hypothetical protein
MRSIITLICLAPILTAQAAAQQKEKPTLPQLKVVWSADEECHLQNSAEAKSSGPSCSLVTAGDRTFRLVLFRGISVAIESKYIFVGSRNYVRSTVQVTNASGSEVQIDPSAWALYHNESEGIGKP